MVTKQLVKDEIDNIPVEHLPMLYKIVLAFEEGSAEWFAKSAGSPESDGERSWSDFVAETYGCFADDPIERGDQGQYEDREPLV